MSDRPEPVERVAQQLARFEADWALCGGWAVDAWVGRQTRDHLDVDVSVFEDDQPALHAHFGGGWLLNGHDLHHDDSTAAWDGHRLVLPAHVHVRGDGVELDVQLNRRAGSEWVVVTEPELALPISAAVRRSAWNVPTLAPEVILLYKAIGNIRPHDEADLGVLLPRLAPAERAWVRSAIARLRPGHPWLRRLA